MKVKCKESFEMGMEYFKDVVVNMIGDQINENPMFEEALQGLIYDISEEWAEPSESLGFVWGGQKIEFGDDK